MLDIKRIRQNPEELLQAAKLRGIQLCTDELLRRDEQRRQLLAEAEEKKTLRNAAAKKMGMAKKQKLPETEIIKMTEEIRTLGAEIEQLDKQIALLSASIENELLSMPNYLHECVPEQENKKTYHWGEIRNFPWEPKTSAEIGKDLSLFEDSISQGRGARLERALMNFFLDQCAHLGYEEAYGLPLSGINSAGLRSPSLMCERILTKLPQRKSSISMNDHCRISHIKLFSATVPKQSERELHHMTTCAERALHMLSLPYRIMLMAAPQTAFNALQTFHVEAWMPSKKQYVAFASFSDCGDYQARRDGTRFRSASGEKPQYVHTISGSMSIHAVAQAILENNQNENGTVTVPEALVPYMGTNMIIAY